MEPKTYFASSTLTSSARRNWSARRGVLFVALAAAGLTLVAGATAAERGRPVAAERGRASPGPGGPGAAGGQRGFATFGPSTGRPAEGNEHGFARGPEEGGLRGGPMGRPEGGPKGGLAGRTSGSTRRSDTPGSGPRRRVWP